MAFVPEGMTRRRIELAVDIPEAHFSEAVLKLGTGSEVIAQDTILFCVWSAAYHLGNFEEAMWWTVRGLGDCDTTCAIVGGIVALSAREVPAAWLTRREPLPEI